MFIPILGQHCFTPREPTKEGDCLVIYFSLCFLKEIKGTDCGIKRKALAMNHTAKNTGNYIKSFWGSVKSRIFYSSLVIVQAHETATTTFRTKLPEFK